jgi:uncharacterized protein YjbI with pentapeptide repeats
MKIIKPLSLGILHQPYRQGKVQRLAIAALGFFGLGRSDERFLAENLQWPRVLPLLPAGQPLDYVLPKRRAEVMLTGAAHAPAPAEAMCVRLQCGPVDKRLRVIGDRQWHRNWWAGRCVDAPQPFKSMPLTHQRAYGGAGHENPLGCAYQSLLAWLLERKGPMPNIEYPGAPTLPGRAALPFAAYAPQQLMHAAARRRASGTYGKRWLAEEFPGLPRDFDFSLYNLTPLDQQFDGRFAGNEAYRLEGLHPALPVLAGALPGLRASAFVLMHGLAVESAQQVALACDTVWFFPEAGVGLMVFRGSAPINDSDALDVRALMLAYESAASVPRSAAHYHEVLGLRLDRATAALHAFNESQLAPERSPAAMAARAAARQRHAAAAAQRRQAVLDETMAEFWRASGLQPPAGFAPPTAPAPQLPGLAPEDIAEGDFDLAELHAQANALADRARRDAEKRLAAAPAELPAVRPQPEEALEKQVAAALARAGEPARDLLPGGGEAALPPELEQVLARAATGAPGSVDPGQVVQARQALAGLPALERAARNAAPAPTTLARALPSPVAGRLGAQVLAWHRAGEVLAGRDLAGAQLRGADLRGADLRETQLERADLRGARLAGANLAKAVLSAALLDEAELDGACLDGANLCGSTALAASMRGASMRQVRAADAVWRRADLRAAAFDEALLMRIDLAGAVLDEVRFSRTVLMQAKAADSRWAGAQWNMSVAPAADFARACFDGARITRSVLMDADLSHSSWRGASLNTVYAGGKANWAGSDLRGMRALKCGWRGASLAGARMQGAVLTSCDFGEADLSEARMEDGQFFRSLFLRGSLRRAGAARASFFQALCRKADMRGADLAGAVLVQADMSEALLQGATMAGAKLSQPARLAL